MNNTHHFRSNNDVGSINHPHESINVHPQIYSYGYSAYSPRNESPAAAHYPYVIQPITYSAAAIAPHQSYPYSSQPGYDRVLYSSYHSPSAVVLSPQQQYAPSPHSHPPPPPWQQTFPPPRGSPHFPHASMFPENLPQFHSPSSPISPEIVSPNAASRRQSHPRPPMNQNHPRPKLEFSTILGRVHVMSQDQAGCKILQKLVKHLSPEQLEVIFQEVALVLPLIFRDVFGNYFFQCYYDQSHTELKQRIVHALSSSLSHGAMNNFGTRSIQFLIRKSTEPVELFLLLKSYLIPHLYHLCIDRYGNHCIKELIINGSYQINGDVVEFLRSRWYELCCHQYGNTVLQICLRTYHEHVLSFAEIITTEALSLMQVRINLCLT
jgi:hypothetical protein